MYAGKTMHQESVVSSIISEILTQFTSNNDYLYLITES